MQIKKATVTATEAAGWIDHIRKPNDRTSDPDRAQSPENPNLARDRLANERTFLSWLRTAIAITSLGFVVARFDIFLIELARVNTEIEEPSGQSDLTVPIGVLLVLSGPLIVVLAAFRYIQTDAALRHGRLESQTIVRNIVVAISLISAVAGIGLAVHLLAIWPR